MILALEEAGKLQPGDTIVEATGGNTGVSLAAIAASRGYGAKFTMPDIIAKEKTSLMTLFGGEVILCPLVPFSDDRYFVHAAARLGALPHHVFTNQVCRRRHR
jgi:cysteine synthase A